MDAYVQTPEVEAVMKRLLSTPLSIAVMQGAYEDAAKKIGRKPTWGMGHFDVYVGYMSLLKPPQRATDANLRNAGFSNLIFNGIPLVQNDNLPMDVLVFGVGSLPDCPYLSDLPEETTYVQRGLVVPHG